jgi:hydrogenase maturation protein HypF
MQTVRLQIRIAGIVQGVGFRPFVYALATRLGLRGYVANDSQGVLIEIEGYRPDVRHFVVGLAREAPPLACIERLTSREMPCRGEDTFTITPSQVNQQRVALIAPDMATCEQCLQELFDPADRRYRYAFTNCTNCGPRFTIIQDVPYDRAATTMAAFAMCHDCTREYHDPADRRFHAQPVACPVCGPRLALVDRHAQPLPGEPVAGAAALLRAGKIVAVKGLGGYHLAVDATDEAAVAALRARKHREEKPFAIMAVDVGMVRTCAELGPEEAPVLTSLRRPVVLLRRLAHAPVARATAPGHRYLGIMLPYTPVHHMLAREVARPLVLTSGNVSDEPIAYRDDEALQRLQTIADAFLTHNRPIHMRTDDSVVRCFRGALLPLRRSRGYVPQPLRLPWGCPRPVLACGAELKNTICVAKGRHAFLSHHIGDVENYEAFQSFTEAIRHFQRLFDVRPSVVAYDLHPDYLSTKWALEQTGVELCGIQHHHAHVASCLVDNGESGPVIGVAFDGLGYGTDGTMWGGEFLLADLTGFERLGHFAAVPMPGGTAAIKQPWRMAAVYLEAAFGPNLPPLALTQRHTAQWHMMLQVARTRQYAPLTSSVGRLFDAVAALLGVRDVVSYEGQAAIELEQLADAAEPGLFSAALSRKSDGFEINGADLIRAVVEALLHHVEPPVIAGRFHNGVAEAILQGCQAAREASGLTTVALSGGVFQNMLLLGRTIDRLQMQGFRVLHHRQVPPNDGGISLGQAVVASRNGGVKSGDALSVHG